MDESLLLAAILGSRQTYEHAIRLGVEAGDFSEAARSLFTAACEQYQRDGTLAAIAEPVLVSQMQRRYGKSDMADSILAYYRDLPTDISSINITEEFRLVRLARCSTLLATRLATGLHDAETDALLLRYRTLITGDTNNDQRAYRLTADDFRHDFSHRIPLFPAFLNAYIGGGVLRGHNLVVYGRPDSGKSLFAINQAAMSCASGYKVLYVANEEPPQDITRRLLSRLTGQNIQDFRSAESITSTLQQEKLAPVYRRWHLLHEAGASTRTVREAAGSIRPDLIIIDQLKNLRATDDNRALQLDKLAREVREIGIEHKAVTISITQAGDSASNKAVLSMNDVEWSNTGIPGAADLMIGVGVTEELEGMGQRMLSIPKNKINGKHGSIKVWVDKDRSRISSKPIRR